MAATADAPHPTAPSPAGMRHPGLLRDGDPLRAAIWLGLLAIALFVLPAILSVYWMGVGTQAAAYALAALGLGLLMGRVGMVSLGMIAVLAIGAWIAAKLLYSTSLPFPIVILLTGVGTAIIGTLVGLPALRLSGLYLALITLMLAGAIGVVLTTTNFPNGGKGFLGYNSSNFNTQGVRRPSLAQSDPGLYRYTLIVLALMFLVALWHVRSKPGRAWAAIRQSEPSAMATGVNVTFYKLWALALASFVTGVGGALLAAQVGVLYTAQFPTVQSIILLAVVLMGGIYSLSGAIVAGIFMKVLPALLDVWNLNPALLTILFGIGVLQVLSTAPAGVVNQFPKDMARLYGLIRRLIGRSPSRTGASP